MFAGHDVAAQRTATLYSLVASAERHGLDPQRYLTGVLARIPSLPVRQLDVGQAAAGAVDGTRISSLRIKHPGSRTGLCSIGFSYAGSPKLIDSCQ